MIIFNLDLIINLFFYFQIIIINKIYMNFNHYTYSQININDNNIVNNEKFLLVPNDSYLNDSRTLKDFKKIAFDTHTKSECMKNFEQSCLKSEIEKACYWAYQLLASGYINQIWDKCYNIIYKNINIQNPNSPEWILNKEKLFRKIVSKKEFAKDAILFTRNIQQIRNILTELITFICLSNKRKIDVLTFKFTQNEFDINVFNSKTIHKHKILIKSILGSNDSKEVILACNELYHSILNKNIQNSIYWITWMYQWEKLNIKKYKVFNVQSRSIEGIDNIYQRDITWLIWSTIQYSSKKLVNDQNLETQLNSLWLLYIFNWKPSCKTKKLNIIIWYISLLISQYSDFSTPVIQNIKLYIKVISNVNLMFKKIKMQENRNTNIQSTQNNSFNNINVIIEDNYTNNNIKTNSKTNNVNNVNNKNKKNKIDNTTQSKLDLMMQLDGYL
jgi:hypothetical protein